LTPFLFLWIAACLLILAFFMGADEPENDDHADSGV